MSHVAVVGAGVIGRAWVVHLVAHGVAVRVCDPAPDLAEQLERARAEATSAMTALGHDLSRWADLVTVTGADVAGAVAGARHVQENGPEREDVRAELLSVVDDVLDPDVPVASSTSTMRPSRLAQLVTRHPERVLVGHPFHPAHLVPLVEVVGSDVTRPDVLDRATDFYRAVGKRPIRLKREVPGHLANRLQAALWREAYSLVEQGVATAADVDAAIAHGPGLRWALLGPLVNQHLSGGAGGLRHVLDHLGPPTQEVMDDLGDVRLTPALRDVLVAGVEKELADVDEHAMARERDALLVDLLAAKSRTAHLP